MSRKISWRPALALGGALVLGLLLGRILFSGPEAGGDDAGVPPLSTAIEEAAEPTVWTCSMHPQVRQPEPGDCPICAMDLIPLEEGGGPEEGPRALSMSEASRALAEIETTTVERRFPELDVRIVGELDYAETHERSISARFPARIEELFVNYTGIRVQEGEHLALVYSPELLTAQRELLTAHRTAPDSSIAAAAREKLRLWGLLPGQIDAILERGTASDRFELRAPTGGIVVAKNVQEGDYVETGEPLFRIADLSLLWLNLKAYESDLPWLRYGQTVTFTVEAYPGEVFTGQIAFIEPAVDRRSRTVPVRVNVPNPEGRLKPGMFARAVVEVRIAEAGDVYAPDLAGKWISPMHPEVIKDAPGSCDVCGMALVPAEELGFVDESLAEAPLVIPSSAVLRTGRRAVVYVRVPDADRPTYEGREVVLGPRADGAFVVLEGLEAGEAVVTHGAFKIDSALQIQAKPSMMSLGPEEETEEENGLELSAALAAEVMPAYLELQDALAADDLEESFAALDAMMEVTGHVGPLPDLIHAMMAADDLAGMRRPHFETLSNALLAAVRDAPEGFDQTLYQMHCPMVYPDRGADWIQDDDELLNPYFGAMMLRCGETVGQLTGDGEAGSEE